MYIISYGLKYPARGRDLPPPEYPEEESIVAVELLETNVAAKVLLFAVRNKEQIDNTILRRQIQVFDDVAAFPIFEVLASKVKNAQIWQTACVVFLEDSYVELMLSGRAFVTYEVWKENNEAVPIYWEWTKIGGAVYYRDEPFLGRVIPWYKAARETAIYITQKGLEPQRDNELFL